MVQLIVTMIILIIVSIICCVTMKKIQPDLFKLYFVYVGLILFIVFVLHLQVVL